jgi:hypothetical protein
MGIQNKLRRKEETPLQKRNKHQQPRKNNTTATMTATPQDPKHLGK